MTIFLRYRAMRRLLHYLAYGLSGLAAGCDDVADDLPQVYAATSERTVADLERCLRDTEAQIAFADAKLDSIGVWRTNDIVIETDDGVRIHLDADPVKTTSVVVRSPKSLTSAQVDVLRKCARQES
jgi:diacylglycerol kinase family enzyme